MGNGRRTEKHIIITWVSAYDSERRRSNSSWPEWVVRKVGEEVGARTCSIPEAELDELFIYKDVLHVVLKDGGLAVGAGQRG